MRKVILYFEPAAKAMFVKQKAPDGSVKVGLSTVNNFFSPGEIIAQIVDLKPGEDIESFVDDRYGFHKIVKPVKIHPGHGVDFDVEIKAYVARTYGFVVVKEGKIGILSPLSYSKDKTVVYYNLYPSKLGKFPVFKEVEEVLHAEKVITVVEPEQYDAQIAKGVVDPSKFFRVIVAKGKEPVHGYDEYYEPLINLEKKAGKMLSDGRIDYKEIDSIVQVQKNQEILKRIDGVKSEDGYDVFGNKVPAEKQPLKGFRRGDNLVQSGHDTSILLASLDGCINVAKNKVSVMPVAVIHGDVDLNSGNIDFNGTVHVTGSVKPGFKVKAAKDIIIDKDVEDAQLYAGGDISVKLGVVGKESVRIETAGSLKAKFLQNAHIEAVKSVEVEDSIINCEIVSYDRIKVVGNGGKIIGGKLLALYEISAHVLGTQNETVTALTVGRNPIVEKELADKRTEIKMVREKIEETTTSLKMHFGEEVFQNPREYIKILPASKKKNCLLLLNDLGTANGSLKKLTEELKAIEGKMKFLEEPIVKASGTVHAGVLLNIKKSVKKIDKPVQNVRLFEDPEDKEVRFTSLV